MKKHLIAMLLTAGCLLSAAIPSAHAISSPFLPAVQQEYQIPAEYHTYHGAEISYVQGNLVIDWAQAKDSGMDFAFIRANDRNNQEEFALSQDAYFDVRVQGAVSAGLPVGISLDSRAITTEEAGQEADFLLNAAQKYDVKLPLLLRLEPDSTPRLLDAFQSGALTQSQATKNILEFCKHVKAAGYQPLLLASPKTLSKFVHQDMIAAEALLCLSESSSTAYDVERYPYRHFSESGTVNGIPNTVSCLSYFSKDALPGTKLPTPQPTADVIFQDVQASDYFCSAVTYSYYHKIMSGVSSDLFSPHTVTSRAMAARILYNLEGMPAVDFVPYYSDVSDGQWFSQAVTWARQAGVMDGYGTTFGPNDAITREQFAAILYRYSNQKGLDTAIHSDSIVQQYQDASQIHDYAQTAMQWAVQNKLIQGYSSSELAPRDHTKRCDCAIIFQRYHSGFAASIFDT